MFLIDAQNCLLKVQEHVDNAGKLFQRVRNKFGGSCPHEPPPWLRVWCPHGYHSFKVWSPIICHFSHGDHWAWPRFSCHLLPQAKADLGVDVETTFLGLDVFFQGWASLAQTHQGVFCFTEFLLQQANCLAQLFDFFLQSASNNTSIQRGMSTNDATSKENNTRKQLSPEFQVGRCATRNAW